MRPLVLLHGFTGSPASFLAVRAALALEREPLAPALLGHDGSPGPADVTSFRAEVDRLARLIRAFTPEPAWLVGYSLGARLALGLLVHHAPLAAGAVLIGVNPGLEAPAERDARAAADQRWQAQLDQGDLAGFVAAWQAQPLFATQRALPPEAQERRDRERLAHSPAGLSRALAVLGLAAMPCYWDKLAALACPVDVVVGELDVRFRPIAERVAACVPSGQLHVVPEAGHNPLLESPAAIARIIRKGIVS